MMGVVVNHVHWPSPRGMANRTVNLNFCHTTKQFHFIKQSLKYNLSGPDPLPTKIVIYSNQRSKVDTCVENLERFLDYNNDLFDRNVLKLVGTLVREEKSAHANLFLNPDDTHRKLDILCATSGVVNVGIDSPNIRAAHRIDFPPSILDIFQERGRARRQPDAKNDNYSCNLCFSLEKFLCLFKRIHDKEEVIQKSYRQEKEDDLFQVTQLLASSSQCHYVDFEKLLYKTEGDQSSAPNCRVCPNYSENYVFPTLNRNGVKKVLFDLLVDVDHCIRSERTAHVLVDRMRKMTGINDLLFKKRARNFEKVDIMKSLFILIAFRILKLRLENGKVTIRIAKLSTSETEPACNIDSYWDQIRQR